MDALGIIGVGFVGTAVREGFAPYFRMETYDRNPEKSTTRSVADLVEKTDGPIFVAVPTPMRPDGSCDISILESVCHEINEADSLGRIVIIKSTVPPGTTAGLAKQFTKLRFVFNPEFLTEANFIDDFKNQKLIVLGSSQDDRVAYELVGEMYDAAFYDVEQRWVGWGEAELFKYLANCFLALKVSFSNELYDLCQQLKLDHSVVVGLAKLDERLGKTHWDVPGPDGHRGFGLSCFPKDINALIRLAKDAGLSMPTLEASWATNLKVRPERDWEQLKGRAVS